MMPGKRDCPLCDGRGGWIDYQADKSILCPLCWPRASEAAAFEHVSLPGWVTSRWPHREAKWYGPWMPVLPWLLVIHSGATGRRIASYFEDPRNANGSPRKVSAHLSWEGDHYEQTVALNRVAWHCGGSRLKLDGLIHRKLNFSSIAVETSGPVDHETTPEERLHTREALVYLLELVPSIRVAVPHSFIDSKKRDPGAGFDWSVFDGLGLDLPHFG